MQDHATFPYLRQVVIFLIAAGIIVPVLHRLRVSPVLGFLVVGGIIGPFGLGLWASEVPLLSYAVISDLDGVRALAELGIIFLLFMVGLELSLDRLWAMRRLVFGLGSLQIVITGAVIGGIAWHFGNPIAASILLGASLALSSTAIVMQLLIQSHRVATPLGRTSFSILLMQDLAVVPILFGIGVLGASTEGGVGWGLALALGKGALAIALIYVVGRLVLRPVLHLVAQTRSPEMFMAAILLMVIGTAAITGAAGMSMALGAFLAGLLLAETEFLHEVEVIIEPFKGLMLGLFFLSVGMEIDWREVAADPLWVAAAVAGLYALKALLTCGICLAFGVPRHTAVETGLLLGQGGEFAFIVVGLAMTTGLLVPAVGHFMLIIASLTMLATPLVAVAARHIATRLEHRDATKTHDGDLDAVAVLEGHVILAGFGRVGRTLASILDAEAVPYLAIDADPGNVAAARAEKMPVFYGDASRLEMLNRAGIDRAQAVVITMDAPVSAAKIARAVRLVWPVMPICARARDAAHAAQLVNQGATVAVPETVEASLQLAARVLSGIGFSEEAVRRRLEQQRLLEQA